MPSGSPLILTLSLLLLVGCPAGEEASTQEEQAPAVENNEDTPSFLLPEASPLEGLAWDGTEHQLSLSEFCDLLIAKGAPALLERCDFSEFEYRLEEEISGTDTTPIGIWVLPEEETPIEFSAQLVAFGAGERMIFGFSAAWYQQNFGAGLEELDEQFRRLHESHDGVLKNYTWSDPDLDISFFQFDFGNEQSGTWGSPYMTHKRFTMHGDIPEWNFFCIGIDAGATLATRQDFIAEAGYSAAPPALPALQPGLQPDDMLLAAESGLQGILELTGINPGSGRRQQDFSLRRLLRPTTLVERFNLQDTDGEALLELQLAERSQLLEMTFIDNWLDSAGIDKAAFLARFEELRHQHDGWEGEEREAADTRMRDSGVILGEWEIARRFFSIGENSGTNSWTIRRLKSWSADEPVD